MWLEDNIKMYLKEIEWKGVDWANLVQDREKWWALVKNIQTTLPNRTRALLHGVSQIPRLFL
jgi:hypothetical protein